MNESYNEKDGAQSTNYGKRKDIESFPIKSEQYYNDIESVLDFEFSLGFLIVGIFTFLPLFFNFIYIRSTNVHARRISTASIVIGSTYFAVFFILANAIQLSKYSFMY
ncbi:hypothetical protein ACTA71_010300 [Dictyostelium dimigraforme]